MTDAHRQWIEERYRNGWKPGYADPHVKIFKNTKTEKDFAYHKVSVVFWQTDEHDQPAIVTERYEKAFTAANIAKEQAFYDSELKFTVRLMDPESGRSATVTFALAPDDRFPKVFDKLVVDAFAPELETRTKKLTECVE